MVISSSSSGIFFQGDERSQALSNLHLSSYENSNLVPRNMYSNMAPVSGDVGNAVIDSMASSGPSVGASSLVTDANSGLSGGTSRLQRSASINKESYMRFPASPLSFSSNNISISGSSVIDGPSPVHQSSNQDADFHIHQGASTATSLPNPSLGQVPFPGSSMFPGSFISDHDNVPLQKKPRLDIKPEDILQQQVLRQIMQRQDSTKLQNPNVQLQTLYQQQQLLQSLPPLQRAHLLQQQQLHSRQHFQQQGLQPASVVDRPYDGGICSRRVMQYLYHQRQRPADISYWRKFVAEYYSPCAKKRWCLSIHNNVGHHPLGVFPPASKDLWQCGICGSKSGRGFEATFEVLARLNEIKFGSGVIDELWFLDMPRECRLTSGIMMLEYGKAVQESVYEQLRVVHEGRLKVIFSPDLKILTWEFCSRRHEELLPRRLVAPQVNQLLEVAQKWQSAIAESGSSGVSQQDLQTNSNLVVTAGRQLARSLDLQSLNDLGSTKRYVRCLQIAEVVNSMKDLMDFSKETKNGPIEALKNFPRQTSVTRLQMQKMHGMEQMLIMPPVDRNALNNQVAFQQRVGLNSSINNSIHIGNRGAPLGSDYQNLLIRQSSINSNSQHGNIVNQNISVFRGQSQQQPYSNIRVGGGFSSLQGSPYQQFPGGIFQVQPNHQAHQGGSQTVQHHHMIQQVLKGMNDNQNGGAGPKPSFSGQSGGEPTRSSSFKAGSHTDSCAPDLPHVSDIFHDIGSELTENGFFNNDGHEDGLQR